MSKDIRDAIESAAQGYIENWLYTGWDNRIPARDIEGEDSGTHSIDLDWGLCIDLAEEFYEEVGQDSLLASIEKAGLRTAIDSAASMQIACLGESLAREFAEALENAVGSLEDHYSRDGHTKTLVSVTNTDPHGWAAPVRVSESLGMWVYEYRKLDGDLDSDVVELEVSVDGEHGSDLTRTFYVRFDLK